MGKAFIDKLAYLYLKDGKLLITLSYGKDTWYIPGGKREEGESDIQALTREVKEELNVDLLPETIKQYGVFEAQAHGKPEGVKVRMRCYTANFTGKLLAGAEVAQLDFFAYDQKRRTSPVDNLIFDDLHKRGLLQ
jgi:8-oxo-dGTP diphosphatase